MGSPRGSSGSASASSAGTLSASASPTAHGSAYSCPSAPRGSGPGPPGRLAPVLRRGGLLPLGALLRLGGRRVLLGLVAGGALRLLAGVLVVVVCHQDSISIGWGVWALCGCSGPA